MGGPDETVRSVERHGKRHLVLPLGSFFGFGLACTGESVKRWDIKDVLARYISCQECRRHL